MDKSDKPETTEATAAAATDVIILPLSKPIPVYDDQRAVLALRKPTGKDLIQIGNPVIFDPISEPPRVNHDMPRMCAMLARLADVPHSSIERLEPEDLVAAAWAVSPFFIPKM